MKTMLTKSCKAKGRRLQNWIAERFRPLFKLEDHECKGQRMGEYGQDIVIPFHAQKRCPYAVEAKNQERVNVWQSWLQAKRNAEINQVPLLVIKRNNSDTLVVMDFDHFEELIRQANNNQIGW